MCQSVGCGRVRRKGTRSCCSLEKGEESGTSYRPRKPRPSWRPCPALFYVSSPPSCSLSSASLFATYTPAAARRWRVPAVLRWSTRLRFCDISQEILKSVPHVHVQKNLVEQQGQSLARGWVTRRDLRGVEEEVKDDAACRVGDQQTTILVLEDLRGARSSRRSAGPLELACVFVCRKRNVDRGRSPGCSGFSSVV